MTRSPIGRGVDIENNLAQYLTLLRRNANVRFLWFSQVVSLFGDWFNFIAATELVTQFAPSGTTISILIGVRTVTPVLGAPLVPFVAKRVRRRTVLIASDLIRCGLVLGLLTVRSADDLWLLYLLIGLQGFLSGVFFPIRTAILPSLVKNESELGAANALGSLSWTAMIAIGTSLGGLVTAAWGISAAFLIDAFTFVLSAWCLLQMRYEAISEEEREQGTRTAFNKPDEQTDVTYGYLFRFLREHKDFMWLSLKKTGVSVFSFIPTQILQILLSRSYPHIGPGSIVLGVIFGVGGAVSFFSPILVRMVTGNNHVRLRNAITFAYLVAVVGMWMQAPIPPFPFLLLGVALRSVGTVIIWTFSTHLLLSLTPRHLLDHLLSFEYFLFNFVGILGVILPAYMVENPQIGVQGSFILLGTAFLLLGVLWGLWNWKGTYILPAGARAQAET